YTGQTVVEAPLNALEKEISAKDKGIINKKLSINFVPGSAEMAQGSEYMLDALGQTLVSFGATYLQIEGNTDSMGARAYNLELSKKRAEAVKRYLMKSFSLPENRFRAVGLGPDNPVASNKTEAGRQLNRRTDIKVIVAAERE
ncbi:MAG: OmpA family protein, partial [Deltaproteobacteria bacterium]|nr:OmpA family protein [Deltaproteobacteria bacterium]